MTAANFLPFCDENLAALLSLFINKHEQKGDRHLNKCRAYPSGSKRRKKAKEAKMREEEVAAKSGNIQVTVHTRLLAASADKPQQ